MRGYDKINDEDFNKFFAVGNWTEPGEANEPEQPEEVEQEETEMT